MRRRLLLLLFVSTLISNLIFAGGVSYYTSYGVIPYTGTDIQRYSMKVGTSNAVFDTVFMSDMFGSSQITSVSFLQHSSCVSYSLIMPGSFPYPVSMASVTPWPAAVIIKITPNAVGNFLNDTLKINLNTWPNVVLIPIKGMVAGNPQIWVSKTSVDFGNLALGSAIKYDTILLRNTGDAPLNITDIFYMGETSRFSARIINDSMQLQVGETRKLRLGANPYSPAGNYSNTLTIFSNSVTLSILSITVNANVYVPATINLDKTFINIDSIGYLVAPKDTSIKITNGSTVQNLIISKASFQIPDSLFEILTTLPITLSPGGSANLSIRINPKRVGYFNNSLQISNTSGNLPEAIITFSGRVAGSYISTTPKGINFGNIGLYSDPRDTIITIKNTGRYSLKFSIQPPKDTSFSIITPLPSDTIISSGGQYSFKVRINPFKIGSKADSIKIINNSANFSIDIVALIANVVAPGLTILPQNYNFGTTSLALPAITKTFTIKNDSRQTISISNKILSGDAEFSFLSIPQTVNLAAGQVDSFQIIFDPKLLGKKTAVLRVNSNDPVSSIQYINISGTGGGKPLITLLPDRLNFGDVSSSTDTNSVVIIRNDGNLLLQLTNKTIAGNDKSAFSIVNGSGPATLDRKKEDTIRIKVNSASVTGGDKTAQLQMISNDSSNLNPKVDLFATIKLPIIFKNLNVMVFDTIAVGNWKDSVFVIRNDGNIFLKINEILVADFQFNDFFISGIKAGDILQPGEAKSVTIRFKPLDIGVRSSRILIRSNDPKNPEVSIIVRGSGKLPLKPIIFVSSDRIDFGSIDPGNSKDISFIIKNKGLQALKIDSVVIAGLNTSFYSIQPPVSLPYQLNPSSADSLKVTVRFSSNKNDTVKNPAAFIRIISNDTSNKSYFVNLTANLLIQVVTKPTINFEKIIDFGTVKIADSLRKQLTINNISPFKITIVNIYLDPLSDNAFSITPLKLPIIIDSLGRLIIDLQFKPSINKEFSTYLNIQSLQVSDTVLKVRLLGKGAKPVIAMLVDTLDFGNTQVNTSKQKTATIINSGEVDLKIDSLVLFGRDVSLFSLISTSLPLIIQPGNQLDVTIKYNPLVIGGPNIAGLRIVSNDNAKPAYILGLKGYGIKSSLSISDTILDFKKIALGDTLEQNITITNNSDSLVKISIIDFETNPDMVFSLNTSPTFSLAFQPGKSQVLPIRYTPKTSTNYFAYLRIYSTAFTANPFRVKLTGGVGTPKMVLPAGITFVKTGIGFSKSIPISIQNSGDASLRINNIVVTGSDSSEFSIEKKTYPFRIDSRDSLIITFAPKREGIKDAKLKILSNDITTLGDVIINAEAIKQNISSNKSSIDFGEVPLRRTKNDTLILRNDSQNPVLLSQIFISGRNQASFVLLSSASGVNLSPGGSTSIIIKFQPDSGGVKTASLDISTSDTFTPKINIPLSGNGLSPQASLNFQSIDFSSVNLSKYVDTTIQIRNNGKGYLFINSSEIESDTASFKMIKKIGGEEIAPGAFNTIICRFKPLSTGTKNGVIKIVSNDPSNLSISLTGKGIAGNVNSSLTQIDFGRLLAFFTKDTVLTISNNGQDKVIINKLRMAGSDSSKFSIINPPGLPFTLNAGSSVQLSVRFVPLTLGSKLANLIVESDALNPVVTINLSGYGAVPLVTIDNSLIAQINQDFVLNFRLSENYLPDEAKIFYKLGGKLNYDSANLNIPQVLPGVFSYTFSKTLITVNGVEFLLKFGWKSRTLSYPSAGGASDNSYSIQVRMQSINSAFRLFTNNYSLITIPLVFNPGTLFDEIIQNLGLVGNINWRIFRWKNGNYQEYVDPSIMQILAGDGFWLIAKENKSLDLKNCLTVPTSSPYKIKLQPGWNQIGNPFLFPLSLSNLVAPPNKNINKVLYGWNLDGSYYKENVKMNPWEGYFIYSFESDTVEISMNPVNYSLNLSKSDISYSNELMPDEWLLNFKLNVGNKTNDLASIGYMKSSYDEWDSNDLLEPPPAPNENVSIRFPHQDWTKYNGYYISDIRGKHEDGYSWNMEIFNSTKLKTGSLSFDITGFLPDNYFINFYDYEKNKATTFTKNDIQKTIPIEFNSNAKKALRITIGTNEYINNDNTAQSSIIRDYRLYQNYPNPFNPTTRIEYALPQSSFVTIKIYDYLGREIETLVNLYQSAGRYSIDWHPDRNKALSSGIYYYKLETGKYSEIKKMIYLR